MNDNTNNANNNANVDGDKVTVQTVSKKREFSLRKTLLWGGASIVAAGAVGAGVLAIVRGRNPGGAIETAARVAAAAASFATKR